MQFVGGHIHNGGHSSIWDYLSIETSHRPIKDQWSRTNEKCIDWVILEGLWSRSNSMTIQRIDSKTYKKYPNWIGDLDSRSGICICHKFWHSPPSLPFFIIRWNLRYGNKKWFMIKIAIFTEQQKALDDLA